MQKEIFFAVLALLYVSCMVLLFKWRKVSLELAAERYRNKCSQDQAKAILENCIMVTVISARETAKLKAKLAESEEDSNPDLRTY